MVVVKVETKVMVNGKVMVMVKLTVAGFPISASTKLHKNRLAQSLGDLSLIESEVKCKPFLKNRVNMIVTTVNDYGIELSSIYFRLVGKPV